MLFLLAPLLSLCSKKPHFRRWDFIWIKAQLGLYSFVHFTSVPDGKYAFLPVWLRDKTEYLTVPEHIAISQEWRIESMKLRPCWVYHFLNVALPFTVASSGVGERVCALCVCVSVCRCGECACKCLCYVQSAWVFLWVWVLLDMALCFCVSRWPKDRCGCLAFREADVKDL